MTSKNSFFKLLKICLRNRVWGIGVSCLLFFFGLPVYTVIAMQNLQDGIKNGYIMAEMGTRIFRYNAFGDGNYAVLFFVIFLGFFLAWSGFGYLFNRQMVDVYHAMPVKRSRFFWANYLAGVIAFAVPYAAGLFCAMLIGQISGFMDGGSYLVLLYFFALNLCAFLMYYSVTVLACMLTGKSSVAGLGTFVLFVYGALVIWCIKYAMDTFLKTYSFYSEKNMPKGWFSPLVYYPVAYTEVYAFRNAPGYSASDILIMALAAAVITVITYLLYQKRGSESAGVSMSFSKTMPVIAILMMAPMGLFGGLFFYGIMSRIGWYVFGAIATLIIGHFMIQAIYFADFKSMFKNLWNIVISAAIVAVISLIFIFDLIGYDTYLPKKEDIAYGSVVSYEFQDSLEYADIKNEVDRYGNPDYWMDAAEYRFDHMKITDMDTLLDLAKAGIEGKKEFDEWNESYDDLSEAEEDSRWVDFTICYTMKNGKKVYRGYQMDVARNMEIYNRLYQNPEYKEGVYQMFGNTNAGVSTTPAYFGPLGACRNFEMTDAQVDAFYEIYKEELKNQDAYDAAKYGPIGYFAREYKRSPEDADSCCTLNQAYIYPSFTKSIAYLEQFGIDVYAAWDLSSIESITVTNYSIDLDSQIEAVETDDMDFAEAVYTDPAQIKEILDACAPSDYVYFDSMLHPTENLDVVIKYKTGKRAEDGSRGSSEIYMAVLKGNLPGFVKSDVRYE